MYHSSRKNKEGDGAGVDGRGTVNLDARAVPAEIASDRDRKFMALALKEAKRAADLEEVPIGAVIVDGEEVVGRGFNRREIDRNPLGHAELIAIGEAAERLGRWRLTGCTLYVTAEPCPMCAGAIVQARIDRLVYGCDDPKTGATGSLYNIVQDERLNHWVEVESGVLADEAGELLRKFFRGRRREDDR